MGGTAHSVPASFGSAKISYELDWIAKYFPTPEPCREDFNRILSLVSRYQKLGEGNHEVRARKTSSEIHTILTNAYRLQNGCFDALSAAYATASTELVHRRGLSAKIVFALFKLGHLHPLSAASRQELGDGLSDDLLGGYECLPGNIFFDPFQSPLNLGGTLLHEIDHLSRDKFYTESQLIDVPASVLLDESSASMVAAYFQIRATTTLYPYTVFGMRKIEPFTFRSDNNLYAKEGFLYRLWKLQEVPTGWVHDRKFLDFWNQLNFRDYDARTAILAIFKHVSEIYFPKSVPNEKVLFSYEESMPEYFAFEKRLALFSVSKRDYDKNVDMDSLRKLLSRPSPRCLRFNDAIGNGELDDYIGSFVAGGVRPGNGGVRPGTRIQPCLKLSSEF